MRHSEAENRKIQNFYKLYSLNFSEILCDWRMSALLKICSFDFYWNFTLKNLYNATLNACDIFVEFSTIEHKVLILYYQPKKLIYQ